MEASKVEGEFSRNLGGRLRAARRRRGLSLARVEELTQAEFKASVVGAYERGERTLSAQRLVGLARLYGVSPAELLPEEPVGRSADVVVDLEAMAADDVVDRFLSAIQLMRASHPDSPTVRRSDLAILSNLVRQVGEKPLTS